MSVFFVKLVYGLMLTILSYRFSEIFYVPSKNAIFERTKMDKGVKESFQCMAKGNQP